MPKQPLSVLYFTHYAELYGANRSLLALAETLQSQGDIRPLILLPCQGPFTEVLASKQIPFVIAPFEMEVYFERGLSRVKGTLRTLRNYRQAGRVLDIARKFNPDLVHTNTAVLLAGDKVARALGKPHIWHLREFGREDYQFRYTLGEKYFLKHLNQASRVVAISGAIRQHYQQKGCTAPVETVYNGVGSQQELLQRKKTGHSAGFVATLAGTLQPAKGQEDAIRAFARLPRSTDFRLNIAGEGLPAYTLYLKNLAEELGVANKVEWLGFRKDLATVYAASDTVLMCSRSEAMGRVTLEAMSYGVPVIGYNGGATPELLSHRQTGLLYQSVQELAEALRLLEASPALAEEMGQKARQFVLRGFGNEQYARKILKIYETLLAEKPE